MSAPPSLATPGLDDAESAAADLDRRDEKAAERADPAATVVPIGDLPALQAPVHRARRLRPPPPTDRARSWVVTGILTALAAMVRLVNLGGATDGGTPLFDEKYYAIQAWEMLRNGGVEDDQAFGVVVHPPLGKQLIAIGEWLLGYNATGWRLASAVAGIVCVLLIIRVVPG